MFWLALVFKKERKAKQNLANAVCSFILEKLKISFGIANIAYKLN